MKNVYLIWSLVLLGAWIAVFAAYAPGRGKMLRMSLVTLPLGLTEPLFVPAYWTPPTIFDLALRTRFDLESLLFAFAVGGLAATLYDALSGARWQSLPVESRSAARHRWHALALATPALVFPVGALRTLDLAHDPRQIIELNRNGRRTPVFSSSKPEHNTWRRLQPSRDSFETIGL